MKKNAKINNLEVRCCNTVFPNPLILPSGIAQEIPKDHQRAIDAGAGGVTLKSLTVEPREGYAVPRIIKFQHGFLNAVGLRNPGLEKGKHVIADFIQNSPVPIIASIFATTIKDFRLLAREVSKLQPACIEVNLSCPHVTSEFGLPLGTDAKSAAITIFAVKEHARHIPIIAKLTPNIPDIGAVAKMCEEGGASAIAAINTVGPGMAIDIQSCRPVLGNKRGGVSGEAIKPIAIRCVYDIYEAVNIPIIGMGGISTWDDTVEMIMAGASLVGIGSATYTKGMRIFEDIKSGLRDYMKRNKINNLSSLVGKAHRK